MKVSPLWPIENPYTPPKTSGRLSSRIYSTPQQNEILQNELVSKSGVKDGTYQIANASSTGSVYSILIGRPKLVFIMMMNDPRSKSSRD